MLKYIRSMVLALGLLVLPMTAMSAGAQTGQEGATPYSSPQPGYTTDNDTDWGWLGLLGLIGLAGLMRRRDVPVEHRRHEPVASR